MMGIDDALVGVGTMSLFTVWLSLQLEKSSSRTIRSRTMMEALYVALQRLFLRNISFFSFLLALTLYCCLVPLVEET